MNTNAWIDFRAGLFKTMEERRTKAGLFQLQQVHFFITRCSKLFNAPGTQEAQDSLDLIQQDGTFLLVADTLKDFIAMFTTVDRPTNQSPQTSMLRREAARPAQQQRQSPLADPESEGRQSGRPFRP